LIYLDLKKEMVEQFHYLLQGRNTLKGLLKEYEGEFIGTGSILLPFEKEDAMKEVFDMWKVNYKIKKILIS